MTKTFGTYGCDCGMTVSLSGMAYRSHDRGRRHREALANGFKWCRDCKLVPAGDRDPRSPFCGACDPNGARYFDLLGTAGR